MTPAKEDITAAKVLKSAGYTTGSEVKWSVGEASSPDFPTKQRFEFFFGCLNQSRAHRFYPDHI